MDTKLRYVRKTRKRAVLKGKKMEGPGIGEESWSGWRRKVGRGSESFGRRGALRVALVGARDGWLLGERVQSGAGETTTAARKCLSEVAFRRRSECLPQPPSLQRN